MNREEAIDTSKDGRSQSFELQGYAATRIYLFGVEGSSWW